MSALTWNKDMCPTDQSLPPTMTRVQFFHLTAPSALLYKRAFVIMDVLYLLQICL